MRTILKSVLRAVRRLMSNAGFPVILMVLIGLGIIVAGVLSFNELCEVGKSMDGWCGITSRNFPWTVISGLATIPAIVLTWIWREEHKRSAERHNEAQIAIAQDGQVTERFTRAIEQLGSDNLSVRMGAIYALGRIAEDSPRDHWPIVETLAAFVRISAPLNVFRGGKEHENFQNDHIAADAQAALTVIARREQGNDPNSGVIDLSHTNLPMAKLEFARLQGANLEGAKLEGANLQEATFKGANLRGANISEAFLPWANLAEANLTETNFECSFIRAVDFEGSNLSGANFWYVGFNQTNLLGADLSGTKLWCSDMGEAKNLTREQLMSAEIDQDTILSPEYADLIPPMPNKDES